LTILPGCLLVKSGAKFNPNRWAQCRLNRWPSANARPPPQLLGGTHRSDHESREVKSPVARDLASINGDKERPRHWPLSTTDRARRGDFWSLQVCESANRDPVALASCPWVPDESRPCCFPVQLSSSSQTLKTVKCSCWHMIQTGWWRLFYRC
jgi:hypothetical protein